MWILDITAPSRQRYINSSRAPEMKDKKAPKSIGSPTPSSVVKSSSGAIVTKNAGKGLQPVLAVVARRGKGRQAAAKKASEGAGANARTAGFDKSDSSVIYLGHIPPAFEEREMRNFFAQFGEVQRLKLYRSQKTNRPKGYAFVEFESSEVARTVSDVMNGYFLQERQLRSNVVPAGKVHEDIFKYRPSAKKAKPEDMKSDDSDSDSDSDDDEKRVKAEAAIKSAERPEPPKEIKAKMKKTIELALKAKQKKLNSMGIEFDFLSFLAPTAAPSKAQPKPKPIAAPTPTTVTTSSNPGSGAKQRGGSSSKKAPK